VQQLPALDTLDGLVLPELRELVVSDGTSESASELVGE
jgi:hypothetical protein